MCSGSPQKMRQCKKKPRDVAMPEQILPTTVVGSYPQPDWLVDHKVFKSQTVPRVRLKEIWRVPEQFLEQAQDDATLIAIRVASSCACSRNCSGTRHISL